MERYLCLDIGDKRIGVAVSDPFNTYALPVKTVFRKNLKADLSEINSLVKERVATAIVCGVPVNFDGTPSVQTEKAKFFIERLKETTGLPIIGVDERCTTCEAEETLIAQGKSRQERKSVVDSLAATSILEGFLNEKNSKGVKNMKDEKHGHCDCGCEETHVHDGCDCGCEHDGCDCCDEETVVLTTDTGEQLKFYLVGTIEYKGKTYSAFEPAEEVEGLEEDDLVIFELSGDDEESAELLPIEDDALLDEVFQEFCRVMEEDELAEEAESLEPDAD